MGTQDTGRRQTRQKNKTKSNTDPTKNGGGGTQVLTKGKQFLSHPPYYLYRQYVSDTTMRKQTQITQGRIQDFKLGGGGGGGGGGRTSKKLPRAEGGAKIVEVFRVKNHDFTPKNHIFSILGGCAPPPPPGSAPDINKRRLIDSIVIYSTYTLSNTSVLLYWSILFVECVDDCCQVLLVILQQCHGKNKLHIDQINNGDV